MFYIKLNILLKYFKNNKIPHAFLLVGKNARQPAHFIAKSLICENDVLACDHCNECRRIDEHNYGDFIYCNGLEETIKKPHIEYIQEQFSKSALEGKSKIYLMENIENSTIEAMNREYNTEYKDVKVYIGPHIRKCCYEVSQELKETFLEETGIPEDVLFDGRRLSLEECILKDIREIGVLEENIYTLNLCTYCNEDIKLHSYRKSNGDYGRLFSFVILK